MSKVAAILWILWQSVNCVGTHFAQYLRNPNLEVKIPYKVVVQIWEKLIESPEIVNRCFSQGVLTSFGESSSVTIDLYLLHHFVCPSLNFLNQSLMVSHNTISIEHKWRWISAALFSSACKTLITEQISQLEAVAISGSVIIQALLTQTLIKLFQSL